MPSAIVHPRIKVVEGNDVFFTARVLTADNTQLIATDWSGQGADTTVCRVFDKSQGGKGLAPDTAIFEKTDIADSGTWQASGTYLTDGYWDGLDSTGYNFFYRLPWGTTGGSTDAYLRANHTYLVQFEIATDSFGTIRWRFTVDVLPGDPS